MSAPIRIQELPRRHDRGALAQVPGVVGLIARDQVLRVAGKRDLKKRLVIRVGEGAHKRRRGHHVTAEFDVVEQCGYLVFIQAELEPVQDLHVFGEDPRIEAQFQFARRDHAYDLSARPEW